MEKEQKRQVWFRLLQFEIVLVTLLAAVPTLFPSSPETCN